MNWLGERVKCAIGPRDTVLDLGCGNLCTTGRLGAVHLAVDGYAAYLNAIKDSGPTLLMELPDDLPMFPDSSYDHVLMLDVLEHLEAVDHQAMIYHAERIARKSVIVFSPEGFMEQEAWDAWGLGHNALQEHRSAVYAADFEKRGYEISWHTTKNHHGTESKAFLAIRRF